MRSTINLGFVVAVSAATVHSAPQGYLAVVGPKPLMFARPSVPLALAISRLPALAAVTPDPRLRYGSETNEPVIMPPPPGSPTNAVAKPAAPPATVLTEAGSGADGTAQPGPQGPPAIPAEGILPGGFGIPGGLQIPEGVYPPGDPRLQSDRGLPLLSPQMLVPFFRNPATTNRTNPIYLSVPFLPGQPAAPGNVPPPAASSTATYEQH
jgi:hypothetical protein